MPRSLQDIIDHADDLAARFETMEPAGEGHAVAVAALRDAVIEVANAERQLSRSVHAARADGLSWAAIGLVVGTSGEGARSRYATPEPRRRQLTADRKDAGGKHGGDNLGRGRAASRSTASGRVVAKKARAKRS